MDMNSLPRWLISITHMPLPRQSSISSPARASTSSGRTAGPALKLKILLMSVQGRALRSRIHRRDRRLGLRAAVAVLPSCAIAAFASRAVAILGAILDARDAGQFLALRQRDQRHSLRRAAHPADLLHRGPD